MSSNNLACKTDSQSSSICPSFQLFSSVKISDSPVILSSKSSSSVSKFPLFSSPSKLLDYQKVTPSYEKSRGFCSFDVRCYTSSSCSTSRIPVFPYPFSIPLPSLPVPPPEKKREINSSFFQNETNCKKDDLQWLTSAKDNLKHLSKLEGGNGSQVSSNSEIDVASCTNNKSTESHVFLNSYENSKIDVPPPNNLIHIVNPDCSTCETFFDKNVYKNDEHSCESVQYPLFDLNTKISETPSILSFNFADNSMIDHKLISGSPADFDSLYCDSLKCCEEVPNQNNTAEIYRKSKDFRQSKTKVDHEKNCKFSKAIDSNSRHLENSDSFISSLLGFELENKNEIKVRSLSSIYLLDDDSLNMNVVKAYSAFINTNYEPTKKFIPEIHHTLAGIQIDNTKNGITPFGNHFHMKQNNSNHFFNVSQKKEYKNKDEFDFIRSKNVSEGMMKCNSFLFRKSNSVLFSSIVVNKYKNSSSNDLDLTIDEKENKTINIQDESIPQNNSTLHELGCEYGTFKQKKHGNLASIEKSHSTDEESCGLNGEIMPLKDDKFHHVSCSTCCFTSCNLSRCQRIQNLRGFSPLTGQKSRTGGINFISQNNSSKEFNQLFWDNSLQFNIDMDQSYSNSPKGSFSSLDSVETPTLPNSPDPQRRIPRPSASRF